MNSDGNSVTLERLFGQSKNERSKEMNDILYDIKSKANAALHFISLSEKHSNISLRAIDQVTALQIFESLKEVILFFVINYGL